MDVVLSVANPLQVFLQLLMLQPGLVFIIIIKDFTSVAGQVQPLDVAH